MDVKILVLDIDGTLTNTKKEVTKVTRQAILDAQEKGVTIVLASGRPTTGILPFVKELKLDQYDGYILSFNGGQVISCRLGETIYKKELPKDLIPYLYKESKENHVTILSYDDENVITEDPDNVYVVKESTINRMPIKKVSDFSQHITYPITKCLMVGDGNRMAVVEEEIKEKFGEQLNIYRSEPFFLEIMPQNIDKAYSLDILLQHLDLTKEQMIAIGDGYNDISMIQFAGLGVAMENAQGVVKEAADVVTLTNEEDGVAHIISQYILKEKR